MTSPTSLQIDINTVVTDAVIEEYWERGYWISPRLFDDEQIANLRAAHERLWAGDYDHEIPSQYGAEQITPGSPQVRQQCNAFWLNDSIRAAVTSPVLGAIGARLMRTATVRLWHDQAIYKPGTGTHEVTTQGNIGWHQDYGYWRAPTTTNMCTARGALPAIGLRHGGMRTIVSLPTWSVVPVRLEGPAQELRDTPGRISVYMTGGLA